MTMPFVLPHRFRWAARSAGLISLLLAAVAASTVGAPAATAQDFIVTGATPVHGTTEVPLHTTVRFEFGLPGDQWAVYEVLDFEAVFRAEPAEAVTISHPQLLLNDAGQPAVVTFDVEHEPGVDVTWLVSDVLAAKVSGAETTLQAMTSPFVLRYTTASDIGTARVMGTVQLADRTTATLTTSTLDRLQPAVRQLTRHRLLMDADRRLAEPSARVSPDAAPGRSVATLQAQEAASQADRTHVFLLEAPTLDFSRRRVAAATVLSGTEGSFAIDFVRPGTYWPLVLRFADATQTRVEALGFYDPDGDGAPDPLDVGTSTRASVHLTTFPFPPRPALSYLDAAATAARAAGDDVELHRVRAAAQPVSDGTAYSWTYDFFSARTNRHAAVTADPLGTEVVVQDASAFIAGLGGLHNVGVDSDAALRQVLADGGAAFLADYAPDNVAVTIDAGRLPWFVVPDPARAYWHVRLTGTNAAGRASYEQYVDMQASPTRTEHEPGAEVLAETRVYPNPTASTATIRFQLPVPTDVRLDVFDLLGRRVSTLAHGSFASGEHLIPSSTLPPGHYVVRLLAGEDVRTLPLVVVR